MGSSKSVVIGYKFYIGIHMITGYPVKKLLGIHAEGKELWAGEITSNESIYIDKPDLFGGEKKEGGVQGSVDIEFGGASQGQNQYLKENMGGGEDIPAFRGVMGLVLNACYVTAMTKYPKPWSIDAEDHPDWYPSKAYIAGQGVEGDADYIPEGSCNGVHILYDVMTTSSEKYGIGLNPSRINEESFMEAADILYDENFGLSLILNQQSQAKQFAQTILSHINAVLYENKSENQWFIKMVRKPTNEDIDDAPVFDESNIVEFVDFERPSFGEMINEVVVKYRPQFAGKDTTLPVQDMASVQNQAAVISQTANYPGIDNATIARRVGLRDVKQYGTPLAKGTIKTNRFGASVLPGDIIKLSWDDYGIDTMICRVFSVNSGSLESGVVTIGFTQDVFTLPETTYINTQPAMWSDPITAPIAVTDQIMVETPYWDIARTFSSGDLSAVESTSAYAQLAAKRPPIATPDYQLWVNIGGGYQDTGNFGFYSPSVTLNGSLGISEGPDTIDVTGIDIYVMNVTIGTYAIVDSEYVRVDNIDQINSQITIARGCLDTYPEAHADGSIIYFAEGNVGESGVEYLAGDTVAAKALVNTDIGRLAIGDALESSVTLYARQDKPYPPGNVQINAAYYPSSTDGDIELTWSHRDRLQQTVDVVDFTEGDIGPEAGTEYEITIIDTDGPTTLKTDTTASNTYDYTTAQETIDHGSVATNLRVEIKSVRGGVDSWQTFTHEWTRTP